MAGTADRMGLRAFDAVILAALAGGCGPKQTVLHGERLPSGDASRDAGAAVAVDARLVEIVTNAIDARLATFDARATNDAADRIDVGDAAAADGPGRPADEVLMDFEDGTARLAPAHGRSGSVYAVNDGTPGGEQQPAPLQPARSELRCGTPPCADGAPGSTRALHLVARGFVTWGALFGTDLAYVGGDPPRRTFDASGFTGVSFWARLGTSTANAVDRTIRFALPDANTDAEGGRCAKAGGALDACYNDWSRTIELTDAWTRYDVAFSTLQQGDFGMSFPAFRADAIYGLQWKLFPGAVVDLWIDDVAFTK